MNQECNTLLDSLYRKYYDVVYHHCLPLVDYDCSYYPLVEDCIQDAFLQAVEDYEQYKDYQNPIGWIIRVAQNKVKSQYRDELRHNRAVSSFYQIESADTAFSIDSIDVFLARHETIKMIVDIYRTLPEHEKKVFIAYFFNDLSQKETCAVTNLSDNSVRAAIQRIRKRARLLKYENFLHFWGAFFFRYATYIWRWK